MFNTIPSYYINNILLNNILIHELNIGLYSNITYNIYKFQKLYNTKFNIVKTIHTY